MTIPRRSLVFLCGAALFVAVPLVTATRGAPHPDSFDLLVLRAVAAMRSPLITTAFTNITSLGSLTLIALHSLIAFALLISTRDRNGAFQLISASAGSWILTQLAKPLIARPRPTAVPALVEATGFSYPSGHAFTAAAMYVTIAILASRHLRLLRQRVVLGLSTAIVVAAIAFSRVYLGVHYATDIVSGVFLGVAWALVVEGFFAARRKASP